MLLICYEKKKWFYNLYTICHGLEYADLNEPQIIHCIGLIIITRYSNIINSISINLYRWPFLGKIIGSL